MENKLPDWLILGGYDFIQQLMSCEKKYLSMNWYIQRFQRAKIKNEKCMQHKNAWSLFSRGPPRDLK